MNGKFTKVLVDWFCISMLVALINAYTLQSDLLMRLCVVGLGLYLIIHPVWPENLSLWWSEKKCRIFIRALAFALILISVLRLLLSR